MFRLKFSAVALLTLACLADVHAQTAQTYPAKPIRFIVPYAPGGSTSQVARLVADEIGVADAVRQLMSRPLKQE